MNTSDADFERFLQEFAEKNRQLGRTEHQIELLEMMQSNRSKRNDFPIVGEFIQLVMFDAPKKVVEGIVDVIRLLKKRSKRDNA